MSNNNSPIKPPSITSVSNGSSPVKPPSSVRSSGVNSSTKVIDSLQSNIDKLTDELTKVKQSNQELKHQKQFLTSKNESFIDQVANLRHENEMNLAMLKRKDRRILDLENLNNDLTNNIDNINMINKQLKFKYENLNSNNFKTIAEYENLKISYDVLNSSLKEYKLHYKNEINEITKKFNDYKIDNAKKWENLSSTIESNDKDVDTLLDGLNNKKKIMDNIYVNKNQKILNILQNLIMLNSKNATENKRILDNNLIIIDQLIEKYPNLLELIKQDDQPQIDLNSIIIESKNISNSIETEEEITLIKSPNFENQKFSHNQNYNKRKNYRNSSSSYNSHSRTSSVSSPTIQSQNNTIKAQSINHHNHNYHHNSSQNQNQQQPKINNNLININKQRNKIGSFNNSPVTTNSSQNSYKRRSYVNNPNKFNNNNGGNNSINGDQKNSYKNKRNSQIFDT
ncbi:SHE3 [Candida jiufengensis]|uniref:SHE3 n=1 Tax=Candida jiufengensis TaxID=497108 RepID=UPI002224DF70|nr:SHE3 [Candida jiufengensis]KAI5950261.1 SHE3 [Candida jiufengensis]